MAKYHQLIKDPNMINQTVQATHDTVEENKTESDISRLISMFKEFAESHQTPMPKAIEETVLNDGQIEYILSSVENIRKSHFPDITFSKDLVKQFIYNIPKPVFYAVQDCIDYGDPDYLNPMILFIPFMVDDLDMEMPYYLKCLKDYLVENNEAIEKLQEVYITDDEEEDDEEASD